jgi:nitroreductase/NAD-dependent dihydropyrimidine dehydrogenase PreA subunit
MEFLYVDRSKCTECGACADVCPASAIYLAAEGPVGTGLRACIACGHCVAVCPVEALDNLYAPISGQVPLEGYEPLDAAAAERFLRSRRSIRSFKEEPVPQELLLKILDIARFASTGGNTQGLSYLVISDRKKLSAISSAVIDWMEGLIAKRADGSDYFVGIVRAARKTGKDMILRGAPHLIVALCDETFPRGAENAHFALAYAELLAPTLGVGTCWAGLFQGCAFNGYAPLLDILEIPPGKKVAGGLMAGFPRHRYYRLVGRNDLEVEWR